MMSLLYIFTNRGEEGKKEFPESRSNSKASASLYYGHLPSVLGAQKHPGQWRITQRGRTPLEDYSSMPPAEVVEMQMTRMNSPYVKPECSDQVQKGMSMGQWHPEVGDTRRRGWTWSEWPKWVTNPFTCMVTRKPDEESWRAVAAMTFSRFSFLVGSDISDALALNLSSPWLCICAQGHQHLPPHPVGIQSVSLMLMRHSDGRPTKAHEDVANYLRGVVWRGAEGTPRGYHRPYDTNIAAWRCRGAGAPHAYARVY